MMSLKKPPLGLGLSTSGTPCFLAGFLLGLIVSLATQVAAQNHPSENCTVLGIDGTSFTLNGKPTFLLGISEYGALGASKDFIRRDLDDLQRLGFHWLRIWATWESFVATSPRSMRRESSPTISGHLRWIVAECDRRGMIVDVTLTTRKVPPDASSTGRIPNCRLIVTPSKLWSRPSRTIATGISTSPMSATSATPALCRSTNSRNSGTWSAGLIPLAWSRPPSAATTSARTTFETPCSRPISISSALTDPAIPTPPARPRPKREPFWP